MTLYVDASAVIKLYVDERESPEAAELLDADWVTGRHTLVEVRRALSVALSGAELEKARQRFVADWRKTDVIELDQVTCDRAARLAEETGSRALDALHLAAAERAGRGRLPMVTYDRRLAAAARSLGWTVLGA